MSVGVVRSVGGDEKPGSHGVMAMPQDTGVSSVLLWSSCIPKTDAVQRGAGGGGVEGVGGSGCSSRFSGILMAISIGGGVESTEVRVLSARNSWSRRWTFAVPTLERGTGGGDGVRSSFSGLGLGALWGESMADWTAVDAMSVKGDCPATPTSGPVGDAGVGDLAAICVPDGDVDD